MFTNQRRAHSLMILCISLLFASLLFLPTTLAIDASDMRSSYAQTLLALAQDSAYKVHCGDTSVLNTANKLKNMAQDSSAQSGFPQDNAVCILDMTPTKKAVIFTAEPGTTAPPVLEHFLLYSDLRITKEDNLNILQPEDLTLAACDAPVEQEENWWFCPNAVTNAQYGDDVNLYYKQGPYMTYLITYGITPRFAESAFDKFINFFTQLFSTGSASTVEKLPRFDQAYFTKEIFANNPRLLQAFFTQNADERTGTAKIIFQNFVTDVSSLIPRAEYGLSADNRQVLSLADMTYPEWLHITTGLNIQQVPGTPLPGAICGGDDPSLDFGESCEADIPLTTTCADLGNYKFGELACDVATCTFDVSDCQSCEDNDGDSYPSNQGQPGELQSLPLALPIGVSTLSTLDPTHASYAAQKALRATGKTDIQVLPLPFTPYKDLLVSFNSVEELIMQRAQTLQTQYANCIASGTTADAACYAQTLSSSTGTATINLLGGAVQTGMQEAVLSGSVFGNINRGTYATLLDALQQESLTPYFALSPGAFSTQDFGVQTPNAQNRMENALTCAVLARALTNVLAEQGLTLNVNTFMYQAPSAQSANQYYSSYQSCRAGIKHVITSAKVYYAPADDPALYAHLADKRFNVATDLADLTPFAYVDGFVTAKPELFVRGTLIPATTAGATYAQLRVATGAPLLISPINPSQPLALENYVDAKRARASAILFTKPLELANKQENILLQLDTVFSELAQANGRLFTPSDIATVQETMLITTQALEQNAPTSAKMYVLGNSLGLPFDLTSCSGATIREANSAGELVASAQDITAFTASHPANFYEISLSDWSCFLAQTSLGTCDALSQAELDCNDASAEVHPGAPEICDNGRDDNCDGLIDTADASCISASSAYLPPPACNMNNICEAGENTNSCIDCYASAEEPISVEGNIHVTYFDGKGSNQGCLASISSPVCSFSITQFSGQRINTGQACADDIKSRIITNCASTHELTKFDLVVNVNTKASTSYNIRGTFELTESIATWCSRITSSPDERDRCIRVNAAQPTSGTANTPFNFFGPGSNFNVGGDMDLFSESGIS